MKYNGNHITAMLSMADLI